MCNINEMTIDELANLLIEVAIRHPELYTECIAPDEYVAHMFKPERMIDVLKEMGLTDDRT